MILDSRSAHLSGAEDGFGAHQVYDTMYPLNINDSDLYPTMKEPPVELTGCTEMVFCAVRFEVGKFFKSLEAAQPSPNLKGVQGHEVLHGSSFDMEKAVQDLEDRMQRKFIKYCDESIPLHLLVTLMARTAICQIRFALHRPRQRVDKGVSLPQSEKDLLFTTCMKMIEDGNLIQTSKPLRGYQWHMNAHLQISAMIYIFNELRYRPVGELVNKAWGEISLVYDHHPEIIAHSRNPIYFEIGNLALKAWENRASGSDRTQGPYELATPRFISTLSSQRETKSPARSAPNSIIGNSNSGGSSSSSISQNLRLLDSGDPQVTPAFPSDHSNLALDYHQTSLAHYIPTDISPAEWEQWQAILEGSQFTNFDFGMPEQGMYPPS
jgi:hypothetical protein